MRKFKDAFHGLSLALRHRAVLVQVVLGVLAVIGGIIIRLDHQEWLAFILSISFVIAMEIMNTAVERVGDYLSPSYDDKIKVIKDLSASAVLVSALGAFAVCICCLLRRIG